MQIFFKLDDFMDELFPKYRASKDLTILKEELTQYYSYGPYKPNVSIEGDLVIISIDTPAIEEDTDYKKVIALCEKGNYTDAKMILIPLIKKNPTISDYHRILGQIYSDEGDQENAINSLIDALKWDPKNGYALIMMGNIFSRFQKDIDTAIKYYDQALLLNPNDHIAINNIGANLLNAGKMQEGVNYLERAFGINPDYPYTTFGLMNAYRKLGYLSVAFDYAIKCMKASDPTQEIYQEAFKTATYLADQLSQNGKGMVVFEEFKSYLEKKTGKEIRVEKDATLPTDAKIEFAENHHRDYHLIKYKGDQVAVEHLMMHELVHLEFAEDAREENANMLFLSGHEKKARFIQDNEKDLNRLRREGYDEIIISNFINGLYYGITGQIFNTPIDLFIEDFMFENYPEMHPYQFLSLQRLVREGKDAVTNKQIAELAPKHILTASKILNMITGIQLKDLYGIDISAEYNALPMERDEAKRMWAEFVEYRIDKQPGEEYEMIKHWGEDLRMEHYYELVNEEDYRINPRTIESVLESIEGDPFGLDVDKNFKENETSQFLESEEAIGTNQAVVWFMVDALQFLKGMHEDQIKVIAFEIAMMGTQGINPSTGHNYKVNSIPGKDFSGYHLLAYYYVSWKLCLPEMVDQLNLPYDDEYKIALIMAETKK